MIYLDYAATAPMRPAALNAMTDALTNEYGNASAICRKGARAKRVLEEARDILAESIGASPSEIFFTSGGTEGDNWALIAGAEAQNRKFFTKDRKISGGKGHIIVSSIEHHAVLHTCDYLESRGFAVTRLPVDANGFVPPASLERALREDTILVSIMLANNEIGTVEPVRELAAIAHSKNPDIVFHTDAVQAYGKIPVQVNDLGVDLLSVSAHKLGGPKGIGFLYIRKKVSIGALIHGGMQERGRRAGTENVPAAAGFAAAVRENMESLLTEAQRERKLQQYLLDKAREAIPDVLLNGPEPGADRLPGNINLVFPGVSAQSLLIRLDMEGICASAGSACTTGSIDPSHVLMAICPDEERVRSSVRFTMGPGTTQEELDETVRILADAVEKIREFRMYQ